MKRVFMSENIFWRRISLAVVLLAISYFAGAGTDIALAENGAVQMNEFGPVAVKQIEPEESKPEAEAVPEEEILADEADLTEDLPILRSVAEFLEDRDPAARPEMISFQPAAESRAGEDEEKAGAKGLSKEMEKLLKRLDEQDAEEKDYAAEFAINSEAQESDLAWDQTELAGNVTLSFTPDEQHDLLFDLYAAAREMAEEQMPEKPAENMPLNETSVLDDREGEKDIPPTPAEGQGAAGEPHFDEMVLSPVMAMGTSLVKMVSFLIFEQMEPAPAPEPEPSEPEPAPAAGVIVIPDTIDVSDLVKSDPEPAAEAEKEDAGVVSESIQPTAKELAEAQKESREQLIESVKQGAEIPIPPAVSEPPASRVQESVQQAGFITSMTLAPQPMMEKMAQKSVSVQAGRLMDKAFSSYKPVYTQFVEKIITPTVILSASYAAPPRLPTYTGSYSAYEPSQRGPSFLNEKFTYSVYAPSSFRYLFGSAYSGSSAGYDSRDRKKKRRYFGVE
jgi:hypothetical protein